MLADAAGEHERVERVGGGGHRTDPGDQAMDEHVERQRSRLVAGGRTGLSAPHAGGAGQGEQPGPVFQGVRDVARCQVLVFFEPQHEPGIECPGSVHGTRAPKPGPAADMSALLSSPGLRIGIPPTSTSDELTFRRVLAFYGASTRRSARRAERCSTVTTPTCGGPAGGGPSRWFGVAARRRVSSCCWGLGWPSSGVSARVPGGDRKSVV
jgi:hypothetical protein